MLASQAVKQLRADNASLEFSFPRARSPDEFRVIPMAGRCRYKGSVRNRTVVLRDRRFLSDFLCVALGRRRNCSIEWNP